MPSEEKRLMSERSFSASLPGESRDGTEPARQTLVLARSAPRVAEPDGRSALPVHRRFEAQVWRHPDEMAVVADGERLTYGELNARANQLARHLRSRGVTGGRHVGILLERRLEMPVALLAVAKAGASYLPLDPGHPPHRLLQIARRGSIAALVTVRKVLEDLPAGTAAQLGEPVLLDDDWPAIAEEPDGDLDTRVDLDELLYVLFTSGSTGAPKGVAMPHRSLDNLLTWQQQQTPVSAGERTLQYTPLTFDVSTQEVFATLCFGGTLVMTGDQVRRDPQELRQLLDRESIGRLFLPAVALQQLAYAAAGRRPRALRHVITAGEQLQVTPAVRSLFADGECRLHNQYGPTETHVVTAYTMPEDVGAWSTLPPIGRPVANIRLFVLGSDMEEVPAGAPGELHVAGPCLARGYLDEPGLTAERFGPLGPPPERLYRTGDLVRLLPDGNLEFLGRLDDQVKIRGHRVELGEVEATIKQHSGVRQAVAVASGSGPAERRLLAYVVPDHAELRAGGAADEAKHVSEWETVWDALHDPARADDYPGWTSSETGRPIPGHQMKEWVDATVERILAWQPDRVLDIGCGTGLQLRRLAPHCSRYVGTDISSAALERLVRSLGPDLSTEVTLRHAPAHDFDGYGVEAFDMVVLNSVVEHFPSVDYLLRVLEGALATVTSGGVIFVGDVRSLPHLETFHASVELHRAPDRLAVPELRQRIARSTRRERQLVVDPAFFAALPRRFPRISHVQVQLRRGRHPNEMTKYRYDVVLHVEKPDAAPRTRMRLDWSRDGLSLETMRRHLIESGLDSLEVTAIPNGRLQREARILDELAATDPPPDAGTLRAALETLPADGIDPERLWTLPEPSGDADRALPYVGCVTFTPGAPDRVDVVYRRTGGTSGPIPLDNADRSGAPRAWSEYGNDPLAQHRLRRLEVDLAEHVAGRLPDYMVPARLVMLDTLPLTTSGKVDRRRLPAPPTERPELTSAFVSPRTDVERQVSAVWRSLLDLDDVGVHDNFMELGGDSLMLTRVHQRLVELYGPQISMVAMFEHPTIHALAQVLTSGVPDPATPLRRGRDGERGAGLRRRARRLRTRRDRVR